MTELTSHNLNLSAAASPHSLKEEPPISTTIDVVDERGLLEKYPNAVIWVVMSTIVIGILMILDETDALKGQCV